MASLMTGCGRSADDAPTSRAGGAEHEDAARPAAHSVPAVAGAANRLASESSPYLLQHAHNPVDWYAWGTEAFAQARESGKPIFLSIGYSACHWCHVMAHESFEDEEAARILNRHFISVKVDREERPDVDRIYMNAVQMLTGAGGWPLSVFLTPELKPFYGGTYFPPTDRFGRPGFKRLLTTIADAWETRRDEVLRSAGSVTDALRRSSAPDPASAADLETADLDRAVSDFSSVFDSSWGGFGRAPKFPPSGGLAFLLRQYRHSGNERALAMSTLTLDRMAFGGMYDQLGGGFHRYSVDREWLVPHFEKMLYDNALLAQVYLDAFLVTGKPLYRRIVVETLDYVLRDMTAPQGGFFSAEDADSEGVEGKFTVWSQQEIRDTLGATESPLVEEHYGVSEAGNFEGANILHVAVPAAELAAAHGVSVPVLRERLQASRSKLLAARSTRVRPGLDDKILASWNGLMISAFAKAGRALGAPRFLAAGCRAATFMAEHMIDGANLWHTHRAGESKVPGYLDDYAFAANGFLDLYESTFDARWLELSVALCEQMRQLFGDEKEHGFFYTCSRHTDLLVRDKTYHDGAVPAGNSIAAALLLRLGEALDRDEYREEAAALLKAAGGWVKRQPQGAGHLLVAADLHLRRPRTLVVVGRRGAPDTASLLAAVQGAFDPYTVCLFVDPGAAADTGRFVQTIPTLQARTTQGGKATAYVCRDFVCQPPVTDAAALGELLARDGAETER